MKKVLITATVFGFLKFEINDIKILKELGYEVHVATNMNEANWLKDDGFLDGLGVIKHQIDFGRSPFDFTNIKAYGQLVRIMKRENYDIVHCHTPVASVITRIAANRYRSKGTMVVYTCHGFHFHKKAKLFDKVLYYPIEYIMAYFTDMIITINQEDYSVIQKFPVKEKRYIPGVGVDTEYISSFDVDKDVVRSQFGVPQNALMILSVGELSDRKNQGIIIEAISKMKMDMVYYVICGTGSYLDYYKRIVEKYGVKERVIFTGQQSHEMVIKLCHACDIGTLPSKIEGLGLAGIEVMAAGKPIVASNVHGMVDYAINDYTGFSCDPYDSDAFANAFMKLCSDKELYIKCSLNAIEVSQKFDVKNAMKLMRENYLYMDEAIRYRRGSENKL